MRRVCSDFDVRQTVERKNEASLWKCSLLRVSFFCWATRKIVVWRKNMKMNLVRGTRYVAIGQRNYHIVSQLVRRGKCMQQFINHEAALWQGTREL